MCVNLDDPIFQRGQMLAPFFAPKIAFTSDCHQRASFCIVANRLMYIENWTRFADMTLHPSTLLFQGE